MEIQSRRTDRLVSSKKAKATKDSPNKSYNVVKFCKGEARHNKGRGSRSNLCNDSTNKVIYVLYKIIAFPSNLYSLTTSTNDFYHRKTIRQLPTKHRLNIFQSINLFKILITKTLQTVALSHVVHLKDIPRQRGKGK